MSVVDLVSGVGARKRKCEMEPIGDGANIMEGCALANGHRFKNLPSKKGRVCEKKE